MESNIKLIITSLGFTALLMVGVTWWSANRGGPDALARNGIHWHPKLTMYVNGEQQEIPANVGIGAAHAPIHTHDDLPIIHLEFGGAVHKDDVRLGRFFEIWGKDMRSFGSNLTMTVNGEENTDYEQYSMQDGDTIELRYE